MSKLEEKEKFHKERLVATPASEREAGYGRKLAMERGSVYQAMRWRCIGPEVQGGRVVAIDGPAGRPEELLVGYATGGLWRTLDLGTSWEPVFEGQSAFGIGDFDVSADGQTIWVGTGENNSQRTSYAGTGVFKSTDAGKSWKNVGLRESHHIGKVVIDPRREDTVWVASIGPLYSDGGERGVFRTTDGGKTWTHSLRLGEDTGVIDLAMHPKDSKTLYASAWERERRAWNFREGGPGTGIYKTVDGGATWRRLDGLPLGSETGRIGIAVAPSRPETVYAFVDNQNPETDFDRVDERLPSGALSLRRYVEASVEDLAKVPKAELERFLGRYLPEDEKAEEVGEAVRAGKLDKAALDEKFRKRDPNVFELAVVSEEVWRSDDGGETWKNVSGRMGSIGGYYWERVSVDPEDWRTVYVCALFLLRSKDGGETWEMVNRSAHVDHHVLWPDPRNPRHVWNGNDGGPYVSLDGGGTWRKLNNLPVGQTTTLAVDDKTPYNVYTGLQDNGTMKGPSTYVPGRTPLERWSAIAGGDGSAIAVDPRNGGDIVYTAAQFGAHGAQNQATRESWNAAASAARGEPRLRYNWISPLVLSPHHPDIVYLGSQKIHRSFNQGRRYEAISPDLTQNVEQGDVPYSTLTTISESPLRFGLVYAGADDGSLQVTRDAGASWQPIPTPERTKWVSRVVASMHKAGRVWCTQTGYREDDFRPYVWLSEDYGATWRSLSAGLPLEGVNVVREDPKDEKTVYLGTDLGVYVSRDLGQTWSPFGGGLPRCAVHDLVVQPKADHLLAATHGRSVWLIELAWLRKLEQEVVAKPLHLWKVDDVRVGRSNLFATGQEWDRKQPPAAEVSFQLWTATAGAATVELVDKASAVVKSSELALVPGLNFGSLSLLVAEGDPRAPAKREGPLADPFAARRPRYVEPGEYTLRVKVGSQAVEGKFTLRQE